MSDNQARFSQGVYDEWSGNSYNQWLAQQGYIVVNVNNRGTNNYGAAFMKAVYRNLGKWEAHDFAETAKYLATKAKDTGIDQQLGPLNPYERRLVHMAAAEVPGVYTESIGDAFTKTVTISARK